MVKNSSKTKELMKDFTKTKVLKDDMDNLEIQNKLLVNTKEYAKMFMNRDKKVFIPLISFMTISSLVWPFTGLNIVSAVLLFVILPFVVAFIYYIITNETRKKIQRINLEDLDLELENNETSILDLKEEYNRIFIKHSN